MPQLRIREEVLNVVLAELLSDRGLISIPESIRHSIKRGRRLPDITIADLSGVRIIIEGRIGNGHPIRNSLFQDARARVEEGLCPFCLAVLYPKGLSRIDSLDNLRNELAITPLIVRVVSEGSEGDWIETNVDGLTDILRRGYDLLVSEDVVTRAVEDLSDSIEKASEILVYTPATPGRLKELLGIPQVNKPNPAEDLRVCRIGSLTLVNALIFHQIISERESRILPPALAISDDYPSERIATAWNFILSEIDYVPIFSLSLNIVTALSGNPGLNEILRELARSAMRITSQRAALRHDLMGRIYHHLLADAKYFGAFYTKVPSATLLLKLTLDPLFIDVDWQDIESINKLRIGDLACGTGTLLKATLQSIVDNYVRACGEQQTRPDLRSLHRGLVEESLWGFDVIPFAIHLSASALVIHDPDVPFADMHLYTLPLGNGRRPNLGSLDFLLTPTLNVQADLFGSPTGPGRMIRSGQTNEPVKIPPLDLCVMNPPFTRSVGGNLLFGNAPDRQRTRMQTELKRIVRKHYVKANITAGLGSVFTALGHQLVKKGGHLALVLPRALLSGVAWEETRKLIGTNYHVRYIITSYEPGGWNFSENTSLSECLIVAKRLKQGETPCSTTFANLWRKPKTSIEALTVSKLIANEQGAQLDLEAGTCTLQTDRVKYGELIIAPPERIQSGQWNEACSFAQTELCRVAYFLAQEKIYIPGQGCVGSIPLVKLSTLGNLGPDRRDIHDGFSLSDTSTTYPAFWGHDTVSVKQLAQFPNHYLAALARAQTNRHLRNPNLLWSRAGRLLIAERLRLNNTRVVSVFLEQPVLSNTWWPFSATEASGVNTYDQERILALWLNSTLGVVSLIANRVETEGAWIDLKKPILESLLVLNPLALSNGQCQALLQAYDSLSKRDLCRLPEIDQDIVRGLIDSTIMSALGIPESLVSLRQMVSWEPLIQG